MRRIGVLGVLITLLGSVSLYGQDFRGKAREFKEFVQDAPRRSMEEVGVINTPLPNRMGFGVPGRWWPVKMVDDTSVYLVKDAHHFLRPDLGDPARSNYILWRTFRGQEPEILLWNCATGEDRAARISELDRLNQERRTRSNKRNEEAAQNRIRRAKESKKRIDARKEAREQAFGRKFTASKVGQEELLGMQQPIADAVVERIAMALSSGQTTAFSDEDVVTIRQHVTAAMALQLQMRDIEWCDAIKTELAPDMWNSQRLRGDIPQSANPRTVIPWLHREIERQIERAEHRVYYEEENRDDPEIMRINEQP